MFNYQLCKIGFFMNGFHEWLVFSPRCRPSDRSQNGDLRQSRDYAEYCCSGGGSHESRYPCTGQPRTTKDELVIFSTHSRR